jgi:hypothetical protein
VAGIFSTSFRLLSTTRTQQASEVFIIVIYSFLVSIEQSLPAKGTTITDFSQTNAATARCCAARFRVSR